MFFAADGGVHGREPWVSDGTEAGTRMLADIYPGPGDAVDHEPYEPATAAARELFFFRARTQTGGVGLWCSDGTAEGTFLLLEASALENLTAVRDRVIFAAPINSRPGSGLWRTDGTVAGTVPIARLGSTLGGVDHDGPFTVAGSRRQSSQHAPRTVVDRPRRRALRRRPRRR